MRRQSVSVVVSDARQAASTSPGSQASVAAAAGIDTTRGDVVSVTQMAFDTSTAEQAADGARRRRGRGERRAHHRA